MQIIKNETFVKVNFRCKEEYKKQLNGSSCIVHISLGQAYHEGEKFLATMDLINETFSSCILILCDTLQRYSLQIEDHTLSEKNAYEKTLRLGNEWLQRNLLAYNYLTIPLKLYRWNDWLNHRDYKTYSDKVVKLYQTDREYKNCLQETIKTFLSRRSDLLPGSREYNRAFSISEKYLLEECPILIPLWQYTNCEFVVYPRFRTSAMSATYDHFMQDTSNSLLKEVALKFNRRVKPKKLSFSYVIDNENKIDTNLELA